jgi:hypothetical protein
MCERGCAADFYFQNQPSLRGRDRLLASFLPTMPNSKELVLGCPTNFWRGSINLMHFRKEEGADSAFTCFFDR